MTTKAARIVNTSAFLVVLGLGACGGSGDSTTCVSGIASLCDKLNPVPATALYTSAPSTITMISGWSASYTVGGGSGVYTATSGNAGIVTANISGTTLTINSIGAGAAPIAVVDSYGKSVTIDVKVLAKGQTNIAPSLFPASITVDDCTTNIPFVFTGGTAPFTIFTSDNFNAPVSGALPLGPDMYFTVSIRALPYAPIIETVTVLDSQSRTAAATITIPYAHASCPNNPLLQTMPASANLRNGETLEFQVSADPAPAQYAPYHTFKFCGVSADPRVCDPNVQGIATVVMDGPASFRVQADLRKTGHTLLTVTSSDGQNTNIPIRVYQQPVSQ